jgi:hypothetical protein
LLAILRGRIVWHYDSDALIVNGVWEFQFWQCIIGFGKRADVGGTKGLLLLVDGVLVGLGSALYMIPHEDKKESVYKISSWPADDQNTCIAGSSPVKDEEISAMTSLKQNTKHQSA